MLLGAAVTEVVEEVETALVEEVDAAMVEEDEAALVEEVDAALVEEEDTALAEEVEAGLVEEVARRERAVVKVAESGLSGMLFSSSMAVLRMAASPSSPGVVGERWGEVVVPRSREASEPPELRSTLMMVDWVRGGREAEGWLGGKGKRDFSDLEAEDVTAADMAMLEILGKGTWKGRINGQQKDL